MIDRMNVYIYGLISRHDKYVERMMIDESSMNGFPLWVLCNLSWGTTKCAYTNDDDSY